MSTAEWTTLERLLLAQAVYKYGEDEWSQIARNLKQHVLLDRPSDYFSQKNCSLQYYLMVEDLDKEKRLSFSLQDMPIVVRLARQLYASRLKELKEAIGQDEDNFLLLISEIQDIRTGKLDTLLTQDVGAEDEERKTIPLVYLQEPEEVFCERKEQERGILTNKDKAVNDLSKDSVYEKVMKEKDAKTYKRLVDDGESLKGQRRKKSRIHEISKSESRLKERRKDNDRTNTSQHTAFASVDMMKKSDRKANKDSRHKSWLKNINLLWKEIVNHKNGAMFMNPIKETTAPHYYGIVKRPMDLKTIRIRIRDGVINTTTGFERDVVLMLTNSLMYNAEGTEVYRMAKEMLEDAAEQIRIFKAVDEEDRSLSRSGPKRMTK